MLTNYSAIIFDFDDTLVNTIETKWAQHKEAAKVFYNLELTDEDLKRVWGQPFPEMVGNLYQHKDAVERIEENYFSLGYKYPKHALPGAVELTNRLLEQNQQLGIISAMTKDSIVEDLTRLDFQLDKFIHIQGADDTKFHKPDPRVFEPLLSIFQQKRIQPTEAVYIGDAIKDYQAATAASFNFLGVTTGLNSKEEFEDLGVQAFPSLQDLLQSIG